MTAVQPPKNLVVLDPRTFDGDPYQVAVRSIQQLIALLDVLGENLDTSALMVRNADLEKELALGNKLGDAGKLWHDSPLGRQLLIISKQLEDSKRRLGSIEKAVGFDPKARSSR